MTSETRSNAKGAGPTDDSWPRPSPSSPRHPAERKVHVAFAVSLLCLAAVGIAAHRSVIHLREDIGWVEHTHQVLDQLEGLDSDIGDLQNALRGYGLGRGDSDRNAIAATTDAMATDVEAIRQLVADNPEQQRRIHDLAEIVGTYGRFGREVVTVGQTRGVDAARTLILTDRGVQLRKAARGAMDAMREVERRLLTEREARARANAATTDMVVFVGSLLALVLAGVSSIVIRRDFTGRRKAEQELERFFTLSLDFLTIAGPDGYFKRVSSGVIDILGWTPEEFVSRPYLELVHPDDREATMAEARRQIERGEKVLHFENRYRHKDGSWRVLSWRSVPSEERLMYGAARDITEQRRVEEEIRRLNATLHNRAEEIEAANKELEAFSYSVSHDLRAPLRHIQGYVDMLERELEGRLDGEARRFLTTIEQSAQRMSDLIDQLLSFSRMGRAEMQTGAVDIAQLIAEVRQELEIATRGRNIEWQVGPIPLVQGDRAMLKLAFANLLGNAVKYTRPRATALIAVGTSGEEDRRVVVFVRDNGVGFEMKHAGRLFGVFQRLHRASDFEGSGIGLANVHRIITRHGGRVWAESKPGEGATFYITLQRAIA